MTERQPDEAIIDIAGHGEFLMQRTNTRLFTFLGNLATRDHIFMALEEPKEDGPTLGAYVFAHADAYYQIFAFVVEHEYPMSLNNLEVAEGDENAFQRSLETLTDDTPDFIPEGWE